MADEKFTNKVAGSIAQSFAAVGLSMGTRLGLFHKLSQLSQSKETAVTSQELADSLSYKERYVREWINGMACADIIDHEEVDGKDRYWLEPYRLPALLGDKMKWTAQFAELLTACVMAQAPVEECFSLNGPKGTDVDDYPGLHEFLSRRGLLWLHPENVMKIIDDESLIKRLEQGIDVLEIGCGASDPCKALSTLFPNSRFTASDMSEMNLSRAKENCKGIKNVSYAVLNACEVPEEMTEKFDFVMLFDVYHDVPYPDQLIAGVKRLLRSGGQFLMNDIDQHESVSENKSEHGSVSGMYYVISALYCTPTSYKYPDGAGLGACAGKELYDRKLKEEFAEVKNVAKDIGLYFLCTK